METKQTKKKVGFIDSCANLDAVSRAGGVSLKAAVASLWSGRVSGGRRVAGIPRVSRRGAGSTPCNWTSSLQLHFFLFFFF